MQLEMPDEQNADSPTSPNKSTTTTIPNYSKYIN